MDTIIERLGGGEMTLDAFAKQHGLTMRVTERSGVHSMSDARYFARFDDVEIMERGMLRSTFGDGPTPEAAIADYAPRIAGQRLVVNAYSGGRMEFQAPNTLTVGEA